MLPSAMPLRVTSIFAAGVSASYAAEVTALPGVDRYAAIPLLMGFAILMVFGVLLTVRFVTRVAAGIRPAAERGTTYECGEEPVGSAWFRLNPRFITVALLFVVFDVELALMWPILPRIGAWIAAGEGAWVALKLGLFVGTLALALAYAWARGDLEWDRS
jgi:NADH-quinone oxidoreductase subunit A